MIKTLCFLALGVVLCHADSASDKFDLSLASAALKGSSIEFTLKIVNQSADPVKIDLASDVLILKADRKADALHTIGVKTRPGIYKARFVIIVPGDKMIFLPTNTSRVFAPATVAPGATLELTRSMAVDPAFLMKDLEASTYEILASLTSEKETDHSSQSTAPSPTYKMSKTPDGKLALTPE